MKDARAGRRRSGRTQPAQRAPAQPSGPSESSEPTGPSGPTEPTARDVDAASDDHRPGPAGPTDAATRSATRRATPGGRPRDRAREAEIVAAALELVADEGLPGLTMDALAARAGASKATLYRRWPDRVHLALHLLDHTAQARPAPPDTGGLRDDLAALLGMLDDQAHGAVGALELGLAVEARRDPKVAAALRLHHAAEHARILAVLERGVERAELDAGAELDLLASLVAAQGRDGAATAAAPGTARRARERAEHLLVSVGAGQERSSR